MILKGKENVYHLQTNNTSYIFRILPSGHLESMYYGRRVEETDDYDYLTFKIKCGYGNTTAYSQKDKKLSLDHIPLEYSSYGKGDYRLPALVVKHENGDFTSDFIFSDAKEVLKPNLKSMPSAYGADQTLCVSLKDSAMKTTLELYYSVFEKSDVITRSARLINNGSETLTIDSMLSMQIDLPMGEYTMLTFDGAWIKERSKNEHKLTSGVCSVGSITGTSSNRHNPFFVVKEDDATEDLGNCYGFNLVYSGNHVARTEVSTHGLLRVQNGINPFEFSWQIKPGESFDAPESVLTFSHEGMNGMSRHMHKFVKDHIVRGEWQYKERPILVNNWEATFFYFDEKKVLSIAKAAKDLGAEMFVLDDGWFGKRNNDNSSLGDWYVNKKKLPGGIKGLSEKVNKMGLKFGLWVEPEMVSPDSDLYRAHPDWALTSDFYDPSQGRNQLVLDLTRREVREYLIDTLTDVFNYGNIEYIKWDMNRQLSDVFSHRNGRRTGEIFHRYVLGLYEILQTLTERFPHILFESCSSGGNRFDLGMFCYMPQCWTSDNTDALDRIYIQSGTSYGYPQSVMTMHVAAETSFACLRSSSIEHRFNVSAFGVLGYELDVTKLSKFERVAIKKQIEFYKQYRNLLQFGEFYRIGDFFKDDVAKWQIVGADKSQSALGYFVDRVKPNGGIDVIKFKGLEPTFKYKLTSRTQLINLKSFGHILNVGPINMDMEDGKFYEFLTNTVKLKSEKVDFTVGGDGLMYAGFRPQQPYTSSGYNTELRMLLDTDSRFYVLNKQEDNG